MTPDDLKDQVDRVGPFLAGKKVFFLGDDDHISPLLAQDFEVKPVVYEFDERIRTNLSTWFGRLGVENSVVSPYDARQPIVIDNPCEAFYINPPYSSRSEGLGVKVWLMRALEACQPTCSGILVMPRNGGNVESKWVGTVEKSVDEFIKQNGFVTTNIEANVSSYDGTTERRLMSSNVYLERTDPSKSLAIDPANLYN